MFQDKDLEKVRKFLSKVDWFRNAQRQGMLRDSALPEMVEHEKCMKKLSEWFDEICGGLEEETKITEPEIKR